MHSLPSGPSRLGAAVWEGTEAIEATVTGPGRHRAAGQGRRGEGARRTGPRASRSRCDARYTWWSSPTGRTPGSGGRSARSPPAGPTPSVWPSAATTPRPAMTNRGSTAGSTSGTRAATSSPATAGSSRSAMAGSTSASVCSRTPSTGGRPSTPPTYSMDAFVADFAPSSWDIRPETSCGPATGGRLPMGMSVGPRAGPGWLVICRDAAGASQPFNGEGIAYGYETGRMAAVSISAWPWRPAAPPRDIDSAVGEYERRLHEESYALYYRVAQAFRPDHRPAPPDARPGRHGHAQPNASWNGCCASCRTSSRPDEVGPAEAAYYAVAALARLGP